MTAQYDFVKTPKPRKDGKPQELHPRIVSRGTITTRRLLEDIHKGSSFTVGDLAGVIASLEDKMASYIREGYNVELGRIGYFSAKLTGRLNGQSFKDLNAFVEQKRLTTYGRGSHLVYMREKPEE